MMTFLIGLGIGLAIAGAIGAVMLVKFARGFFW